MRYSGLRVGGSTVVNGEVRPCRGVSEYIGHAGGEARYRITYDAGAGEEELPLSALKEMEVIGEEGQQQAEVQPEVAPRSPGPAAVRARKRVSFQS